MGTSSSKSKNLAAPPNSPRRGVEISTTIDKDMQPMVTEPGKIFWAIVTPPEDYKYPPLGRPTPSTYDESQFGFRIIQGREALNDILAKYPKTLWQDRFDPRLTFIGNDPVPLGMLKLPDEVKE